MRALLPAVAFGVALLADPIYAQNPPAAQPPKPAPTQPVMPAPKPAPMPQAPQPPRPFPEGSKIAFINIQRIANESGEGKSSTTRVQALNQKKVAELNEKQKALQAAQQKLQQGGTVLSDSARAQLEKDIEKMNVEIQRFTQDAQAEVQDLQQDLQEEFQRKLLPIIQQVASEKALHIIFSQADAGIVWADSGLDITSDVIKRFDQAAGSSTPTQPKPPAAKPPDR